MQQPSDIFKNADTPLSHFALHCRNDFPARIEKDGQEGWPPVVESQRAEGGPPRPSSAHHIPGCTFEETIDFAGFLPHRTGLRFATA
jgi:hypothetical protein